MDIDTDIQPENHKKSRSIIIKELTGAAKTLVPILARFFVDVSFIPMLASAAVPGVFSPASGLSFSGCHSIHYIIMIIASYNFIIIITIIVVVVVTRQQQ